MRYALQVAVDGAFVTREFDAEEEAIEAVGEMIHKYEELAPDFPDVVTLVLIPPGPPTSHRSVDPMGPETVEGGLIGQQPY